MHRSSFRENIMALTIQSTLRMNNGVEIPRFGLGTWQSASGQEAQDAVRWALEAGYRHIDTAAVYNNEQDVGSGIAASGVPRDEIFLVTKVWNDDQGYDKTLRAFDVSAKKLRTEMIDLYLVHWPVKELRKETWKALIRLYEEKRCRAIGISNFNTRHLSDLLADSPIVPAANQIEISPFLQRPELVKMCRQSGVIVEAYSPLARGRKLEDPRLARIAQRHGKTPAQVAIRWALQNDFVVIPKSVHKERIQQNAQVFDFELDQSDLREMAGMDENYFTISSSFNPETSPRWN
jgi:diketogulonate reductase-like aldo/keto reductase